METGDGYNPFCIINKCLQSFLHSSLQIFAEIESCTRLMAECSPASHTGGPLGNISVFPAKPYGPGWARF